MADLDLDLIMDKRSTITLFGKKIPLKTVSMREHLQNEAMIQDLNTIPLTEYEKASKLIVKYLMKIMEITKEDATKVSNEQFNAIRDFMKRKEMLDQGFSNAEIDKMEKDVIKKELAKTIKG
jgi:hypothetical protein